MKNTNTIWRKLVGKPNDFTPTNRIFNSVSVITISLLILLVLINLKLQLYGSLYINLSVLIIQLVSYYFSRVKKNYHIGIIVYAICCYATLFANYFYNGGIEGPTIFAFFLTFQLLIAITKRSQHIFWAVLHILIAAVLLILEYNLPELIQVHYTGREEKYLDIISTYFICLLFIYLITIHLRNSFSKEKQLAEERSEEIKRHLREIELQNAKLKEIAWMQSHKVRGQVATILGLCQFIDEDNVDEEEYKQVLDGIKTASLELDDVVKEINKMTVKAKIEH